MSGGHSLQKNKAGLLRTGWWERRGPERNLSGSVIEDGDVEAGISADQVRGSEEGDTAAGGGEGCSDTDPVQAQAGTARR